MDSPRYRHGAIQTVQSLCRALGVVEPMLRSVADRAATLYVGPKPQQKKSGGIRYVFDTKPPLKPLLRKINSVFFRRVYYPQYLTGSLSGRDFVANVDIHKGSRRVVTEDIAQFFDCISESQVRRIWQEFFGFAREVAEILTRLTTKDGRVFQGTPTSSYLANLAFWDREPALVERMTARGLRYSRFVDDVTISTDGLMTETDKRWAIAQTYALMGGAGFKPKRAKHGAFTARGPITIMGLNANSSKQPTLTKQERANIRAQVFQLEQRIAAGNIGVDLHVSLRQAASRVGRLRRLHAVEGAALRRRLDAIRRVAVGAVRN